jgi:hypothetical protein
MKKPYVKGSAFVKTQEVDAYSKWGLEEIRSHLWMLVVGFSVLLGIGVSFLSLSPDILVAPGKSFNLDNPLATPFMISDQGVLPLHSIQLWWVPTSMKNTLTGHTLSCPKTDLS